MIPQTSETPSIRHNFPANVQTDYEACPTCGQAIPPDKLEEIRGRIAVKERDRTLAITAELEKQFAADKKLAEAKAQADLDALRVESAEREARTRQESQESAAKLLNEKLAEAERVRQEAVAKSKQQVEAAESARKSAERNGEALEAKLLEAEQSSAKKIEEMKAEAVDREVKVRDEAKRLADLEAATKIAEYEAAKTGAENERTALAQQVETLRTTNEAEVAKVKSEAAVAAARIRQDATEAAELRTRDTVAGHEKAAEEARTKAREAEQHAAELTQTVASQREIMEKDKENAVNAERARAFEENQKLSNKVGELQRALEKKTANELGEGAEVDAFEALRAEFPDDRINRIGKGTPGADIRQVVMDHGKECGTILYESKNLKKWCPDHVTKLREDQVAEKAEHAVLSTHKFPQGTSQVHNQDGVVIVNPARVVAVATILRQHILQVHTLRLSEVERESKTAELYDFITSEPFTQLLSQIDERANGLLELQEKEMKWHQNNWKKQGETIRSIQKAKADLESRISLIIGTSAEDGTSTEES